MTRALRASPNDARRTIRPRVAVLAAIGLVAVALVACGTGPASSPVTPPPTASDVAGGPTPRPTNWPGSVVEAILALGTADAEIAKAGADLGYAAEYVDLELMWGAADGLAKLIEAVSPNVDRLEAYEPMRPLAEEYRTAFTPMLEGARRLRDSITAGDAGGVESGSGLIALGIAAYGQIRPQLGGLIEQALTMKRLLVK